ncbi:glycerophosphodiester phosphodiesterase family protein [Dyadobacter psychrotolerans]|uniref:Glycerophosphodiester phosphodiesterase family protein n=2 Tax=Dyadobacter psychrotolerans TaxID=2541721 RepID=A0A4R5DT08_9BACT|nr:glycerophosphodiester phosphodiesterase family protein [Dyadobacter psychrotolerans]
MVKSKIIIAIAVLVSISVGTNLRAQKLNVLKVKTVSDLHSFFQFTGNDVMLIAGHRGGVLKGFPENSIPALAEILKHTPAFFEIDPRLTKDSVIVLMHDATLDRTTTGKGKLSDYTYSELKALKLKDGFGNVTEFVIPTLSEVIIWARGKTILNLDHKDVPLKMTADLIRKHRADAFVMVTVHSQAEARFYLDDNKDRMFSAFIRTKKDFEGYEKAGIPFSQMIAYIGPQVKPENRELYELLNKKGTMCMISAASSYDKLKIEEERKASYISILKDGASILESDYPIDAAAAIQKDIKQSSPKKEFFGRQ